MLKVSYELDLQRFDAWSGGEDTLSALTPEQINSLEYQLEDIFGDEVDETTLNDFLWYEKDTIAEMLGFRNWEHLENGENQITVRIYDIAWDIEEDDDVDDLPTEVVHTFDDHYEIDDDLIEEITDWLSDEYGYCHDGYEVEEI